jgi:hypothetical protein
MKKIVTVLISLFVFEVFLFASEQPAKAQDCGSKDGYGLPCWRDFLDSGEGDETLPLYPYAKRPNGCSIPGGRPGEYDNFGSLGYDFSFRDVCNRHDRCYYTLGTIGIQCNNDFTQGLFKVCKDGASQRLRPQDILTGGASRAIAIENCLRRAEWMSQAVVTGGLPFPGNYHQEAQNKQRRYLNKVGEFIASERSRPYCVTVDSRSGWQRFNLPRSFTKVASIGGGWSVDTRSYAPVSSSGHTGRDADALRPYNQYKFDQRFPFGALLMGSGQGTLWIQSPNSFSSAPFGAVDMRINDADNALGDNGGSLQVCFGN